MPANIVIESIYTIIILLSCAFIVRHTGRFYTLSMHDGIRHFQLSFAFWGLGFLLRYLMFVMQSILPGWLGMILDVAFEYLVCLGGLFLVYSLIWRQMTKAAPGPSSCLMRKLALHGLALAIALADAALGAYHFLFIVLIIATGYATLLTYDHWRSCENRAVGTTFSCLYMLAMIMAFIGYAINYAAELFSSKHPSLIYAAYILTAIGFVIILFGVMRIVHSPQYCDRCCSEVHHGKKTRKA